MAENAFLNQDIRPIIFGEVLYDHFPDDSKVLGGAPFNVAWHLQGFGMHPLLLSRIGDDADGHAVLERMAAWGMDTLAMQHDAAHPTGMVDITLHNDQPQFHIAANQAYDHIEYEKFKSTSTGHAHTILYHGTLAARSPESRNTLHRLREDQKLSTFVDINLRPPWWQQEEVDWALDGAHWVKLNDDELFQQCSATVSLSEAAQQLAKNHHIETLIVTLGSRGALLLQHDDIYHCAAAQVTDLVDSVGAGDAFSAVILLGLSRRWGAERLLQNAVDFAAAICRRRGATVYDKDFYNEFLNQWED